MGRARAMMVLAVGTLIAHGQVVRFDFVNFDDPAYVVENWNIQGGLWDSQGWGLNLDTILWAFEETRIQGHWHPLTWLSLAADYQLFGLKPWGYHLTNLLLHLGSTLLLFEVLRRSTGSVGRSLMVAGLFAWHPLHVESVAWITERKDVLSTLFWMLAMLAYIGYVRRPSWKSYGLVALYLVLGLLSKPMVVTLPLVLLLWDYWPLGRFPFAPPTAEPGKATTRWILLEKVPLLLLALASGLWTTWVMRSHMARKVEPGVVLTPLARLDNALWAYVTYLRKMAWPVDLAPYYPIDFGAEPTFDAAGPALLLAICTLLALLAWKRAPYVTVGWLWYVGTLAPVSGRFQAGSYTCADRYTYVPLIGIFVAIVWGLGDCLRGRWGRRLLAGIGAGVLTLCAVLTWFQVQIWADSETLWTHTLAVTSGNFLAHTNLGIDLERQDRGEEALEQFRQAVDAYPQHVPAYRRLAAAYRKFGRPDEALTVYRQLVTLAPGDPDRRRELAQALRAVGRDQEAIEQESEADRLFHEER